MPNETRAQEIARLTREIEERYARLAFLMLGSQAEGVSVFDEVFPLMKEKP